MSTNKTIATAKPVEAFLAGIEEEKRREDCIRLSSLMEQLTGARPQMWGDSIVGFGDYHYRYASGREGDWFLVGFSPRKKYLSIYIMGYLEFFQDILDRLGKYRNGKGCLYINSLEDIDTEVLKELIRTSIERLKKAGSLA